MKTNLTVWAKTLVLSIATIAVFTLSQGVARADEVTISGNTTGIVTGVPQLTFVGNAFFTGTTALGVGSLSGLNSLGSFHLSPDLTQLLNGNFSLNFLFARRYQWRPRHFLYSNCPWKCLAERGSRRSQYQLSQSHSDIHFQ